MKKWMKATAVASLISFSMAACTTDGTGNINKSDIGMLLGAGGGAVAGAQFGKGRGRLVGVAAGTLLGAALGRSIGGSLDKADMAYYNNASQNTLETAKTGSTSAWSNPDSGTSGTITPTRTYEVSGSYCREYTQTIRVQGKLEEGYGKACRQPDGSWRIIQ